MVPTLHIFSVKFLQFTAQNTLANRTGCSRLLLQLVCLLVLSATGVACSQPLTDAAPFQDTSTLKSTLEARSQQELDLDRDAKRLEQPYTAQRRQGLPKRRQGAGSR
jgi:hypothetical protein